MYPVTSASRIIEMKMIKDDAHFYYDLMNSVITSKHSGILVPPLVPFLSLFVVESRQYLIGTHQDYAQQLRIQHQELLHHMRTKIKLFEESDLTQIVDSITSFQRSHFVDSHKGALAWLKRLLQADLGLYFYGDHLISTTHIVFSYLARQRDKNGDYGASAMNDVRTVSPLIGHEIGRYIAHLYIDLVMSEGSHPISLCHNNIDDRLIRSRDVKATEYLSATFNGPTSVQLNTCLVLCQAFANLVHVLIPRLAIGEPWQLFKLKYVALYQLSTSLAKLRNYYYPMNQLTEGSKDFLNLILKNNELNFLFSQPDFRNILVHYSLSQARLSENKLDAKTQLFGLAESFYDGCTAEDLSKMLDRQWARISELIAAWSKCPATRSKIITNDEQT